jgi:cysteine-rich repeat protein
MARPEWCNSGRRWIGTRFRRASLVCLASLVAAVIPTGSSKAQTSASFAVRGATLNAGGGRATSAGFVLNGCLLPDPVVGGRVSSSSFVVTTGCALVPTAFCGDGTVDSGEQCDDGNTTNADCCSDSCQFESSATVCRPASGDCDEAEICTGSTAACPGDSFAASTVVCRTSAGVCDVAETCTGSSGACPGDSKSTAVCRVSGGVCDQGAEICDGTSNDCPADSLAASTFVCRTPAGVCDLAETCTGSSGACPSDSKSTAVCRASGGVCDLGAEICDGTGNDCSADSLAASTVVCRASAGICDVAENCTGSTAVCPGDQFLSASMPCRPASGICDISESCTGVDAACAADGIVPPGTPCGDAGATECSAPDSCDAIGTCSANDSSIGTSCDDGDACTATDTCAADGACVGTPIVCDDGNPCTQDSCQVGTGECEYLSAPATTCRQAGRAGLGLKPPGANGKLSWKWSRGESTSCAAIGTPSVDTDYDLCIYDGTGSGQYAPPSHLHLPASGLWSVRDECDWTYSDNDVAVDGIKKIKLKPTDEPDKSAIGLSARGLLVPIPAPVAADRFMSMDPNVTVQLLNSLGECWESDFIEAKKNTGNTFRTNRLILTPP